MKRFKHVHYMPGIAMLLLFANPLLAQYTISSPTGNSQWERGKSYTISWTSDMSAPDSFRIEFNYTDGPLGFSELSENRYASAAGSCTFTVGANKDVGHYYTICFLDETENEMACSETFSVIEATNTGVDEQVQKIQDIKIFPVPVTKESTVQFTLNERAAVKITMYNILGKEEYVLKNETLSAGIVNIPIAHTLQSGVYFLMINTPERSYCKRIQVN